jgi:hypothetical protein
MEHLLDVSRFHYSPLQTKIQFDPNKFREVTVDHVMERCFVDLLSKFDGRDGKLSLLEQDKEALYEETYDCTGDTDLLLKKFSQSEILGHGKSTIYTLIRKHVKEIFDKNVSTFDLSINEEIQSGFINFIVKVDIEQITKLTFICQIRKGAAHSTQMFCQFNSFKIKKPFSFFGFFGC